MKNIVKGHCATWTIEETEKGFLVKPNRPDKTVYYNSLETAKQAIRTAEKRYLEAKPNAPVANKDIWCDHGVLWIEDIDGNYY